MPNKSLLSYRKSESITTSFLLPTIETSEVIITGHTAQREPIPVFGCAQYAVSEARRLTATFGASQRAKNLTIRKKSFARQNSLPPLQNQIHRIISRRLRHVKSSSDEWKRDGRVSCRRWLIWHVDGMPSTNTYPRFDTWRKLHIEPWLSRCRSFETTKPLQEPERLLPKVVY